MSTCLFANNIYPKSFDENTSDIFDDTDSVRTREPLLLGVQLLR